MYSDFLDTLQPLQTFRAYPDYQGARGLRAICETVMIDVMFDTPSNNHDNLVITPEFAKEKIEKVSAVRLQVG